MDRVAVVYNARSGTLLAKAVESAEEQLTQAFGRRPLAAGPSPKPGRDRLDAGRLTVYITRDRTNWGLVAVATKLFDGSWQQDERIRRYEGRTVEVRSSRLALMSVMSDAAVRLGRS